MRSLIVRDSFAHPSAKGNAGEAVWLELLNTCPPQRYQAVNTFEINSNGIFSDQIHVIAFDRQYSLFTFVYEKQTITPDESVYVVFQAKQTLDLEMIKYV